ncbi:MAG: glycosyltransferase family 4 protein [Proteobacteria bacterium]|nr:glycosyltransferase family 4 protein [Pseudomonadota bacterium]MBU1388546.1 glycosyltransferase family 4 protein [Pseudomonadota bacterium]MBU1544843.1 glycosyltransferase family 4 protein [Pseudomonadota bacterium]MBU2482678.1 glycosyltransferase family 4 protein [Pseudomonadota bacterium]
MKISFVAVKGIPIGGGIEKLTEEIGSRLVKKGHEVVVYTSRDYGTVDGVYKGMQIRTVPSVNTKSLHKLSICFNATLDVLKRRDADIVHVHAIGPSLFSVFPRMVGIPSVVQTHGIEWQRDKWGFIGRTFLKLSDYTAVYFPNVTTAVSKVQKTYFEQQYGKKVSYIPTGVNVVEYRKPDKILELGLEKDKYILFAARLVAEKGPDFLIEAFRGIYTDMKLVVAGDAAHAEEFKARLKELAADDSRIIFPGFVTGQLLEELFSNAYVFCLPSTLEGLPIALLEAMSYGSCCLSSDIPENREAVEDFGYTFKNRDVPDLRNKLEYLLHHPEKVEAKKQAARDHVLEKYSWDTITDQMEDLYLSIVRR